MVPFMGPSPLAEGALRNWKSLLQPDGTPIEYSWKWNTTQSPPDIRYDIEPIGKFAGTKVDPLNQAALREMLHRLAEAMPTVDLTWSDHFFNTLFDHDMSKYVAEAAAGKQPTTSGVIAAEFLEKGIRFKTYLQPRRIGYPGIIPLEMWEAALDPLGLDSSARAVLTEFLKTSEAGKQLKPFSVAVDNVKPEKSRLKWYFNCPSTAFSTVREVLTLGGRIPTPHQSQQLSDLFELVKAVQGLSDDFPEEKEVPFINHRQSDELDPETAPAVLPGYVFYFDIAHDASYPNIKFALPTINLGRDDLALSGAITNWMKTHGRGEYCDQYVTALQKMARGKDLGDTKGLQSFVAALFLPNGELDMTTYFAPAALNTPVEEITNGVNGAENGVQNGH